MSRQREYRRGIQTKLSLTSGLLVMISLASFALLSYLVTRRTLDDQMGERLVSHAKAAAFYMQRFERVLLSGAPILPGGNAYTILQKELEGIRDAANLDNVILIDAESKVLVDAIGELSVGEKYAIVEADADELESVWAGKALSSLLYPGKDGRLYKSAYAPIVDKDNRVIAVLRVEASAVFLNDINNVGVILLMSALIITAVAALLGMLTARSIVVPIKKLVVASQRIADGDLDTKVFIRSRDEIGFFARTFNQMARNLKKLYEEVEERGRQIAEMSASVAHEVRSPISTIQGFTELLEDELEEDDPRREYTEDIKAEIKILNSKVTDFIHFAKPLDIDPIPLDILEVLESAIASTEKEADDSGVSTITNFGSDLPEVPGDFEQLRGLFTNLIRNAIQSMDQGGGLIISVKAVREDNQNRNNSANFLEVKIEDTGCGMSAEALERAFDPFFTTKSSGTGLGLAIVKKIVSVHNGSIQLESNEGQGTTVKVLLPGNEDATGKKKK